MTREALDRCEERLEAIIWEDEREGALDEAAAAIDAVLGDLDGLAPLGDEAESRRRGLVALALMRKANLARQQGSPDRAAAVDREALEVARTADDLTLGRCLLSMAASEFATGRADAGMEFLEEARTTLLTGDSPDHRQALGWSRVLFLDVVNAGLLEAAEGDVAAAAAEALGILRTIHNWAGVARVLEALAALEDRQGHGAAAGALRATAAAYNDLAKEERQ